MFEIVFGGNPFLRYTKAHVGYLIAFGLLVLTAFGLLSIGVQWNLAGTRHYNLYVAMMMQVVALGIYAMPGHFVLGWIGGYIRHQAGGEEGLSIEDGLNGGNAWVKGIARGLGVILFWISFPWIVGGVIDFRGFENLIGVTLTICIPVIVGAMLLYPESVQFRKFVWKSYVSILIVIFIVLAGNTVWRSFTSEVGHTAADTEATLQNRLSENDQKILSGILHKARGAEVSDGDDEADVQKRFIATLSKIEQKVYQKYLAMAKKESPVAIGKGVASEAKEVWDGVWYEKTLSKEVESFRPTKLCGIKPGTRKFEIPGSQFLAYIGMQGYNIKTAIRINGSVEGEKFTVEQDGCADVSFAFTKELADASVTAFVLPVKLR
ncbi:MAG: hypothetical protein WAU28_02270 [Candidatus Moraniibacteriota bacterium]